MTANQPYHRRVNENIGQKIMAIIHIDDGLAAKLNDVATQENVSVTILLGKLLSDWQEDHSDIKRADKAYQYYLDSEKKTHSLADVEEALGLDS